MDRKVSVGREKNKKRSLNRVGKEIRRKVRKGGRGNREKEKCRDKMIKNQGMKR